MHLIRILIVDDQILFAEGLKRVLEVDASDMKIVGIAHDGQEAIELVEKKHPHVVLMDVRMPNMDGVQATRIIHKDFPETQIIMLTTFDDDHYVHDALHYGAAGYLLKDISPTEVITSIRAINEGGVLISQTIAAKLIEKSYNNSKTSYQGPEWLKNLSKKEKDIIKLISQGFSNSEIAKRLFLGEQTVRNYVSVIYSKLNVHDRAHAMKMVYEADINSVHD